MHTIKVVSPQHCRYRNDRRVSRQTRYTYPIRSPRKVLSIGQEMARIVPVIPLKKSFPVPCLFLHPLRMNTIRAYTCRLSGSDHILVKSFRILLPKVPAGTIGSLVARCSIRSAGSGTFLCSSIPLKAVYWSVRRLHSITFNCRSYAAE